MPTTTYPGTVERAFELARSGCVANLTGLRLSLKREGYGDWRMQTDGKTIQRQLFALIKAARPIGEQRQDQDAQAAA